MTTNGTNLHDDRHWNLTRHPDDEALSAYLDHQLDPAVRRNVAAHLVDCMECRARLGELRAVVGLLSQLPEIAPRRSFALTPAMLEKRQPRILQWLPRLRVMTAVAATLLVLTFAGDYATRTEPAPAAPAAQEAPDAGGAGAGATEASPPAAPAAARQQGQSSPQPDATPAAAFAATPQPAEAAPAAEEPAAAKRSTDETPATEDASAMAESTPEAAGAASTAQQHEERAAGASAFPWFTARIALGLLVFMLLVTIIVAPRLAPAQRRNR